MVTVCRHGFWMSATAAASIPFQEKKRFDPPLHGFTLVELLVVVTIIALLVALLLPAVQAAREAARRAQCQNNIKQLGLACQSYESQYQCFPPSLYFRPGHHPGDDTVHLSNWAINILPFLEQESLYHGFDLSIPVSDSANRTARGTHMAVMRCPSDSGGRMPFNYSNKYADGDNWARGNYAANASLLAVGSAGGIGPNAIGWTNHWYRGVMGANAAIGMSEISDGTSNTILLAEVRSGVSQYDPRGVWALNMAGASSIWEMGSDDDNGPNFCAVGADNIQGSKCQDLLDDMGKANALAACLSCGPKYSYTDQAAPRSCHQGGVYTAFADGSVHFVSNHVETTRLWAIWPETVPNSGNFLTWQRLCASQDGLAVDSAKY